MRPQGSEDIRDRLGFLQFVGIYIAILIACTGPGVILYALFGVEPMRVILVSMGAAFLLAAWGRPWWLSATLRTVGWYAALPNTLLTYFFVILGLLAIGLGLSGQLPPEALIRHH